jgi:hypothetical protein
VKKLLLAIASAVLVASAPGAATPGACFGSAPVLPAHAPAPFSFVDTPLIIEVHPEGGDVLGMQEVAEGMQSILCTVG